MSVDYNNPLDEALEALAAAKISEAVAKDVRLKAEDAVIALLPKKEKGSVSKKGDYFKGTVTFDQTISVDPAALAAIKDKINPERFAAAIKYKPDTIAAGLKDMKDNHADEYAILAQALISKPSKPAVKVELIAKAEAKLSALETHAPAPKLEAAPVVEAVAVAEEAAPAMPGWLAKQMGKAA
ncbi:DUF7173 family protein [Dyella caseinilytica]|uniref:Uncharacterized protein n=1 Tax=Dyella caseinilytica TaxID=1849581 RepID=A0ABX7GQ91_9GAMM|nr:hypothetical protein [Dyella caseinilytica]QRN52425.1 hypothetical protein ISN74_13160 [Dyella caseinilytica]GGA05865.1 hypothetical protein GCM10011408_28520 [Dyella caseinilytica]